MATKPGRKKIQCSINNNGSENLGHGYKAMRKSNLKEMFIVRYADDFRIFCRNKTQAERIKIAVTQWLSERLKLEVSQEKTRVVNVKRRYSEFLGFKIKVHTKGSKELVKSHMADEQLKRVRRELVQQAKEIAKPKHGRTERDEIKLYNSKVMGTQNYYRIATHINIDCAGLNRSVMTVLTNRFHGKRLKRKGRELTQVEKERYGKSQMMRYSADEPIYPISYVKHKNPMARKRNICSYTAEGREGIHDNLRVNVSLMQKLMRQPVRGRSVEYADNRISLFSAQWGKCAVTGVEFQNLSDIHCHHKTPRVKGGSDKFENLTLVLETVHILIHAKSEEAVAKYMESLNLNPEQMEKLNKLRQMAGRTNIN
jgi:Reverse transcriptase (RNA-dependent DNA polymerase).